MRAESECEHPEVATVTRTAGRGLTVPVTTICTECGADV